MSKLKKILVLKTITYRLLSIAITGVISYTITGSFALAGTIVGLDSIIKIVAYYMHEYVYAKALKHKKKAIKFEVSIIQEVED